MTETTASGGNRHGLEAAVRDAVGAVADPELPVMTLSMLGMVEAVEVDGAHASVELLPTFAGCPATEMIGEDVRAAALTVDGIATVAVRFVFSPAWTPARITAEGHDRLREFGIAPPTGEGAISPVTPRGRRGLPVLAETVAARSALPPRPCPWCASTETTRESAFGPTPCRDIRFCAACQQPFEAFKS